MIDGIVKERTLRNLDANEAFSLRRRVIPYFEQEAVHLQYCTPTNVLHLLMITTSKLV